MKELLIEFEERLAQFGAPVIRHLNPPMGNPDELINFVKINYGEQVETPIDLIEVYKWHNGTNYQNAENGIIKLGYFADELCLETLPNIRSTIEADSVYDYIANQTFPFCTSFNGEELAVTLDDSNSLIFCSTSDYEIPSMIKMYDNLVSFFSTLIEFYQAGCFQIDGSGIIGLDFDKYNLYMQIGELMNPQSDYWRIKREFQEM